MTPSAGVPADARAEYRRVDMAEIHEAGRSRRSDDHEVGGGIPYFPQRERLVDLELIETRTFSSRVVYLRYRVAR
jgi:hypothetical protein